LGWRETYILLSVLVAAIGVPTLAWLARSPPKPTTTHAVADTRPRPGLDVWLIGLGYFGCGFSDQFVSLHLVTLATEKGLDPLLAAGLLSLLLLIGMVGSVASGPLADRMQARHLLAGLYLSRAVAFPLLLFGSPALVAFALLFGPSYIANQAPGARLIRDRYGVKAVGPLMGGVGLAHQVGGAIGVGAGGLSVSELGSYGPAVILTSVVVLIGGVAQLWIPPAKSEQNLPKY
jgi:predicted MFS family arabinose efflux permease